ncbi:MAG: hypothetical protein A2252_00360 [Elusimicrobia bacterium RIFOXYA2_FULL_39_19]|nr:MAG: hypothetical protein A2252_00360 [Elusimicrobia bacterium RIFOXYA2_FULL_39_19]
MHKINKKTFGIFTAVVLVLFALSCVTMSEAKTKKSAKTKQTKKVSSSAPARKLSVLNFSKGELPSSVSETVSAVLTEENIEAGDELGLKINFNGRGWCGCGKIDRSWSGFGSFKFNAFNPQDKDLTFTLVIKDKESITNKVGRDTWIVLPFVLKPGMNNVSLDLNKAKPYGEKRDLDLSEIKTWHFSYKFFPEQKWEETGPDEVTIFVSDMRVEG